MNIKLNIIFTYLLGKMLRSPTEANNANMLSTRYYSLYLFPSLKSNVRKFKRKKPL